jgi:tetratricopeptide (TPR) repeat protein
VERGLTQEELAGTEYTAAYVSTLEAGRRNASEEAVRYFAARLQIHPDELRTGRPASLLPELDLELQEARLAASDGHLDEAEEAFSRIAKKASVYALAPAEAKALEGLGLVLERRGKVKEAIERFRSAEKLLQSEPLHIRADAVAGQARSFHLDGEKTHAIYLLERYLHALQQEGLADPDALIRIYTSLVITYVEAGYLKQASDAAEKALELEERVIDPARLGAMHNMVARSLLERRELKRAEESLRKAERYYRLAELKLELARARLARGIFLRRTNKSEQAERFLLEAQSGFQETDSPLDEARARTELGGIARETGKTEEAVSFLQRAAELVGEDAGQRGFIERELGLTKVSVDPTAAEAHLRKAIELFINAEERVEATITHGHLGDLLEASQRDGCTVYRVGIELLIGDR